MKREDSVTLSETTLFIHACRLCFGCTFVVAKVVTRFFRDNACPTPDSMADSYVIIGLLIVTILELLVLQILHVSTLNLSDHLAPTHKPQLPRPCPSICPHGFTCPRPPWQQRDKAKWQVMWVLFIEVAAYGSNTISPDAEHVTFKLENGTAL